MIRGILIILTLAGLSSFATGAQTATVTLAWTPSSSTNIAGYDIYYGTSSGDYTSMMSVANVAEVTIPGLTYGTTYYFAAKTYDYIGNLSAFSPEISYVAGITSAIPAVMTSPCASPRGNYNFQVSGSAGFEYAVEASTDLVNWVVVEINTAPFKFVDCQASQFSRRFYRMAYAPDIIGASTSLTPLAGLITSNYMNASGQFCFTVSGTVNYPYAIEASTDLVNWIILTTNDAPFNFVDTQAGQFSHRSYRAVPAPDAAATSTTATPPATVTQSPTPAVTSSSVNAAGQLGFTVTGIPGYPYVVEASTDLVNWTVLETNAAPFNFVDTNAANFSRRFYRAVYFPN
jgi:Fibronectin type III domain